MSVSSSKAVFLDRDGVLNRAIVRAGKPYPPATLQELEILPEAPQALTDLKQRAFLLLVVTNQPDVARGTQQRSEVEKMHFAIAGALPVDEFFVCYHDDRDGCDCRKPKPGLLLQAAQKYGLQLKDSYLIGDRWRDIDAGAAAGCATIWIDRGYAERGPSHLPTARVSCLRDAAQWIIARSSGEKEMNQ